MVSQRRGDHTQTVIYSLGYRIKKIAHGAERKTNEDLLRQPRSNEESRTSS